MTNTLTNARAEYETKSGQVVKTSLSATPASANDRLYLVALSGFPKFRPVYDALSAMTFYNPHPGRIRELSPADAGEQLRTDGENLAISFIVEGHGELDAVPLLARRVCSELAPERYVYIRKPIRVTRDRLIRNPEQLRKSLLLARQKALPSSENARVFVILDADDDCPVEIADDLRTKAGEIVPADSNGNLLEL